MTIETGGTLGRYTIQGMIGRGGMANVYKAFQPALERVVALKVMRAALTEDPEFVERFRREARAVARLEHPNIVQIYDFDEIDGHSVLAMQFLDGGTLKERLTEVGGPLPPPEAARIVRGVAEALDHAHSLDIVHRDVKPSNVMLTKLGRVVVTDFGIAKMLGSSTTQYTQTGVGVGTPDYMSPEQGQGMPIDRRADVYALGAVAYEMLTGRVPFTAETPLAVVFKHVRDPLPRPSSLNPAIGPAIEAVLDKAMAKQPDDRYPTAGAFAAALEEAVAAPTRVPLPIVPPTEAVVAPAAPARAALPIPLIAAGIGVLVLLGGGVAVGALVSRQSIAPIVAPTVPAPSTNAAAQVIAPSPAVPQQADQPVTCTPATGDTQTTFNCLVTGLVPGATPTINGGPPPLVLGVVNADGTYVYRVKPGTSGTFAVTITTGAVTKSAQFEVVAAPVAAAPASPNAPPQTPVAPPVTPQTAAPVAAGSGSASCSPASAPADAQVTCSFTGFPPGAALTVTTQYENQRAFPVPPPPGQTLSADASGTWLFYVSTTGAPRGTFKVTASGGGLTLVAQYQVQ